MTTSTTTFGPASLKLDAAAETARIAASIQRTVGRRLRRKGVVVGLSGGIDSSVVAALCVRALGPKRVFGIMMPERDSSDDSNRLGQLLAETLQIDSTVEDMTPLLDGAGCYRRRDDAIRQVVPEYDETYKSKIVLPDLGDSVYRVFSVVVQSPDGEQRRERLPLDAYQTIVAATNFKQRCRKMMEYFHADRLRYAVAGTPNRLEYDQGFFVKNGDGAADLKPISHLYKTQVYQLAEFLGVPDDIRNRPPTTDTYSLEQSQEEFFFSISYEVLDMCLFGFIHNVPAAEVAAALAQHEQKSWTAEQVERIYDDIVAKRKVAEYLHHSPIAVEESAV